MLHISKITEALSSAFSGNISDSSSVINKTPFVPYCKWAGTLLGKTFEGLENPLCDIFRAVPTNKGICHTFNMGRIGKAIQNK